jgi:hypothetical protein
VDTAARLHVKPRGELVSPASLDSPIVPTMECTMHRQLKAWIAGENAPQEVRVGRYRADAVVEGRLIEVQVSSLAALSRKLAELLDEHRVRVVKPIVARKTIVKRIGKLATRR